MMTVQYVSETDLYAEGAGAVLEGPGEMRRHLQQTELAENTATVGLTQLYEAGSVDGVTRTAGHGQDAGAARTHLAAAEPQSVDGSHLHTGQGERGLAQQG